jgi:tRNA (cytidine56-2'-O)-methyltransferase
MTGANEDDTFRSIEKVNSIWGGDFRAEYSKDWRAVVKSWKGVRVHLTMYGQRLDKAIAGIIRDAIRRNAGLLVIVGAEKVPREIYSLADYNVSVSNQPHSEIGALAIFLDRFFRGKELYYSFPNARIKIAPSPKEKRVRKIK